MKNFKTTIIAFIVAPMILMSCGENRSKKSAEADDELGKLKFEIPAELKDKPEVVNYIESMNEVADEYALIVDQIMDEAGHLAGVPEEELSTMQKIKLVKLMADVGMKSTMTMAKWAEYQERRVTIEEQMTDAELEALASVWTRFEERMKQIDEKYKGGLLKENRE